MLKRLLAVCSALLVLSAITGAGLITQSGARYTPSEFSVGNPLFYDPFDGTTLNRNDSSATKDAWAQNRDGTGGVGDYFDLKDFNAAANRAFWFYTVGPSDLPAVAGAAFPFPSQKAMMMEIYPQLATANEEHQADGHLQINGLPNHYFVQCWYMLVDDSATTNVMPSKLSASSKLLYPAAVHPGGRTLAVFGYRTVEHLDPSYSAGEKAAFEAGTVPLSEMYVAITGTSAGPLYRMVNNNALEAPRPEQFQNMSKQHLMPNTWMLYRFEFDFSQADKLVARVWNSPNGTDDLTLILDTDVSGVTWPNDGNAGGELAIMQQPTIIQAEPLDDDAGGTDKGRIWLVQGEYAIAELASDLPTYSDFLIYWLPMMAFLRRGRPDIRTNDDEFHQRIAA